MTTSVFLQGFGLSLSLILAIGAQNAFVLRQGLRREHVAVVVLLCALSDAAMITAGVYAFAAAERVLPALVPVLRWGGAAFLIVYGAMSFRAAWRGGDALRAGPDSAASLGRVVLSCLAVTWLNPHFYLDTFGLIGSVSTSFARARASFAAGGITASALFFLCLGYGARLLQPLFARPMSWRVLDAGIGCVMWAIAAGLMLG